MIATSFDQWSMIVTIVVLLIVWATYIPLVGTRPEKSRDYLVWSVYLTLVALVSNWVLIWAVGQLF